MKREIAAPPDQPFTQNLKTVSGKGNNSGSAVHSLSKQHGGAEREGDVQVYLRARHDLMNPLSFPRASKYVRTVPWPVLDPSMSLRPYVRDAPSTSTIWGNSVHIQAFLPWSTNANKLIYTDCNSVLYTSLITLKTMVIPAFSSSSIDKDIIYKR